MKVVIKPSKVSGSIAVPPSKSYTHRAIIIASLASGISTIINPLVSDDIHNTIEACRKLGAEIVAKKDRLMIKGVNGRFPRSKSQIKIFCGLSGTTMRLITAVSALSQNKVMIDGEKRLRERPIKDLIAALNKLGMKIKFINKNNLLPVLINGGQFEGGKVSLSGNISSQFLSALLIISPYAKKDTTLVVENLKSKPYVDITIDLMKTFGVDVKVDGEKYFVKSNQHYKDREYMVEGDYSSASYFFAAAALTDSKIKVTNLNSNSVQGDKYFLAILKTMTDKNLHGIEVNLENYPDIVPSVAVIAANAKGDTIINNIKHLRTKESDRIYSVTSQLSKMGIKVKTTADAMFITGGRLKGASIDTFNDHRIAMSFAVAGLVASGETVINDAEVVNKSYPNFWKDFATIGANIKIIN